MSWVNPKSLMTVFGFVMSGALTVYLTLHHGSPGPLSAAHAQAVSGTSIESCSQCHTDQGLTHGCLTCHSEIAEQLDQIRGYHGYLLFAGPRICQSCHPEHYGRDFCLVSDLAWQGQGLPAFNHPHVDFRLTGQHDGLSCAACHRDKLTIPFALPAFAGQPRATSYLGLSQDCICCHASPHRTEWDEDCQTCHFPTDPKWGQGQRGTGVQVHAKTGFVLDAIHAAVACDACHPPDRPYAQRYGDPDCVRRADNCRGCHQNPHQGSIQDRYESCSDCHDPKRLVPRWWQMEKITVPPKSF